MSQEGLSFLIVIIIIIIITGTTMLILLLTVFRPSGSIGNIPCSGVTKSLINVSNTPCYYNSQGFCSLNKYTDQILGGTFLYTTPTNYTVVCNPLCVGYLNNNWECCTDNNPECQSMVDSYNNCVNTLKPNQCNGEAMPVAVDGDILYYAGQVSSNIGAKTCNCSSIGR